MKLGVDIVNIDGSQAVGPAEPSEYVAPPVLPIQVYNMSAEGWRRASAGSITLADLGAMLRALGLQGSLDVEPGANLVSGIAAWVIEALKEPDAPASYPPLLLAALAQKQNPAVDLANGQIKPYEVRLTLLDLEVLLTGLTRTMRVTATSEFFLQDSLPEPEKKTMGTNPPGDCSKLKESLGVLGIGLGEAVQQTSDAIQGLVIHEALKKAGVSTTQEAVSKALSILKTALGVVRLAHFYRNTQVDVTVNGSAEVHRPAGPPDALGQGPEPEHKVGFTAHAGVSAAEYEAWNRAFMGGDAGLVVKDCIAQLGLPTLPDVGALAKEAENWLVGWSIVEGGGTHVRIANGAVPDFASGGWRNKLTRASNTEATNTFEVSLIPEPGPQHLGIVDAGRATVEASVDSSSPPDFSTFIAGASGVVDVSLGWIRTLIQPRSSASLRISYHHEYKGWKGTVTARLAAQPGLVYRNSAGCFQEKELQELLYEQTWSVLGSVPSGGGFGQGAQPTSISGFPNPAPAEMLHGIGATTCALVTHQTDAVVCSDRSKGVKYTLTSGSAEYSLVDPTALLKRTPPSPAENELAFSAHVIFDRPLGSAEPNAPVRYAISFPLIVCPHFVGSQLVNTPNPLTQLPQLSNGKSDMTLFIEIPDSVHAFSHYFGPATTNPDDPNRLDGSVQVAATSFVATIPEVAVPTLFSLEWHLRR